MAKNTPSGAGPPPQVVPTAAPRSPPPRVVGPSPRCICAWGASLLPDVLRCLSAVVTRAPHCRPGSGRTM